MVAMRLVCMVGCLTAACLALEAQQALRVVRSHRIVQSNPYCEWFQKGEASESQVRDLVTQFSVFSNLFLLAQMRRCLAAPSLEAMRESKEILANEIGVVFKPPSKKNKKGGGGDDDVFSSAGSIEGGRFTHRAAHFEWLLDVGDAVGLGFNDLGKRRHGSKETLVFCDSLYDIYGSEDLSVSLGASFAIEHWANAGFWDCLVDGFEALNKRDDAAQRIATPISFWRFHQQLEAQHAQHTMDELEEAIEMGLITDDAKFEKAANDILDACAVFWTGLDDSRKRIRKQEESNVAYAR